MMISKISFNSSGNKIPQNSSIASANVTSAPISDVKIPFVKTNNLTPPNPNFVQVSKVNNYIQRMNTQIYPILAENIAAQLKKLNSDEISSIEEIRLRVNKPIVLETINQRKVSEYIVTGDDITLTIEQMCNRSVYAFLDEIKQGFITLPGGHRVGVGGKVVIDRGKVSNITNISAINLRLAKQIIGVAQPYINNIITNGTINNTLIISPPGVGKTTLLRDIARLLSVDYKVSVVDERGEICASNNGIPQYDFGVNLDCLDLCPKAIGIELMVRAMSPNVILVDEVATQADTNAIKYALSCGVSVIATTHGNSVEDAKFDISHFNNIMLIKNINGSRVIEFERLPNGAVPND